jgi:anti-sigma B factor antagonist
VPEPHVIAPTGELDITASRALAPQLNAAAGDVNAQLVIDLSEVTFVDSTGLGAIVQTHRRLSRQGRVMAIVAPKGSAAAVLLDLSGLRGRLPTFETRAEALAA